MQSNEYRWDDKCLFATKMQMTLTDRLWFTELHCISNKKHRLQDVLGVYLKNRCVMRSGLKWAALKTVAQM